MASVGGDSSGGESGLQINVGKTDGRQTKTRGKGAKVTKSMNVSWKPGDIVWAKVSGFKINYWPAKVQYSAMVPSRLRGPPCNDYTLGCYNMYNMIW